MYDTLSDNNLTLISKYSVEQVELIKGFGVWVCQGACYKNWCFGSGEFCLSFTPPPPKFSVFFFGLLIVVLYGGLFALSFFSSSNKNSANLLPSVKKKRVWIQRLEVENYITKTTCNITNSKYVTKKYPPYIWCLSEQLLLCFLQFVNSGTMEVRDQFRIVKWAPARKRRATKLRSNFFFIFDMT